MEVFLEAETGLESESLGRRVGVAGMGRSTAGNTVGHERVGGGRGVRVSVCLSIDSRLSAARGGSGCAGHRVGLRQTQTRTAQQRL